MAYEMKPSSLVVGLHIAGSPPVFYVVFVLIYTCMSPLHRFCSNQVAYRSELLLLMLRLDAIYIHVVHHVVHIHVAKGLQS
jgi:hypothetical protein